jgi:hypothetical protein
MLEAEQTMPAAMDSVRSKKTVVRGACGYNPLPRIDPCRTIACHCVTVSLHLLRQSLRADAPAVASAPGSLLHMNLGGV